MLFTVGMEDYSAAIRVPHTTACHSQVCLCSICETHAALQGYEAEPGRPAAPTSCLSWLPCKSNKIHSPCACTPCALKQHLELAGPDRTIRLHAGLPCLPWAARASPCSRRSHRRTHTGTRTEARAWALLCMLSAGATLQGYYEDRRPASNMDPYLVTGMLVSTTLGIPIPGASSSGSKSQSNKSQPPRECSGETTGSTSSSEAASRSSSALIDEIDKHSCPPGPGHP